MKSSSFLSPAYIASLVKSSSPLGQIDSMVRSEMFTGYSTTRAVTAFIKGTGLLERVEFDRSFKPTCKGDVEQALKEAYNDAIMNSRKFHDELLETSRQDTVEEADSFIEEIISSVPEIERLNPIFPADVLNRPKKE